MFTFIVSLDACLAGFALLIILSIITSLPIFLCVENWIRKIAISVATVYVNEYEIEYSALKLCVILERLLFLRSPTSSHCTVTDCISLPVCGDLKTLLRYAAAWKCVRYHTVSWPTSGKLMSFLSYSVWFDYFS